MMPTPDILLRHPAWLESALETLRADPPQDDNARMQRVIALARQNIETDSGGPFAAAIFDIDSGELIAAGVNAVITNHCSLAHAEMMAIATAQQQLQSHDLGAPYLPRLTLITSCEPCAMCFGALHWSGIRRIVCGATAADAAAIGFDEGPRHPEWQQELITRGIEVVTERCRAEAATVLRDYRGRIYNGRNND